MIKNYLNIIASLYIEGFKNMKIGKKLWLLIIIKLIIMFGILKAFILIPNFKPTKKKANL